MLVMAIHALITHFIGSLHAEAQSYGNSNNNGLYSVWSTLSFSTYYARYMEAFTLKNFKPCVNFVLVILSVPKLLPMISCYKKLLIYSFGRNFQHSVTNIYISLYCYVQMRWCSKVENMPLIKHKRKKENLNNLVGLELAVFWYLIMEAIAEVWSMCGES